MFEYVEKKQWIKIITPPLIMTFLLMQGLLHQTPLLLNVLLNLFPLYWFSKINLYHVQKKNIMSRILYLPEDYQEALLSIEEYISNESMADNSKLKILQMIVEIFEHADVEK